MSERVRPSAVAGTPHFLANASPAAVSVPSSAKATETGGPFCSELLRCLFAGKRLDHDGEPPRAGVGMHRAVLEPGIVERGCEIRGERIHQRPQRLGRQFLGADFDQEMARPAHCCAALRLWLPLPTVATIGKPRASRLA